MADLTPEQEVAWSQIVTGEAYDMIQKYKNKIKGYDQKLIDARLRGAPAENIAKAESELLKMRQALNGAINAHNEVLGVIQTAARTLRIDYTPRLAGLGALGTPLLIAGYTITQVAVAAGILFSTLALSLWAFSDFMRTVQGKDPVVNDIFSRIMSPQSVQALTGGITSIAIVAAVGFALYIGWQVMKKKELV